MFLAKQAVPRCFMLETTCRVRMERTVAFSIIWQKIDERIAASHPSHPSQTEEVKLKMQRSLWA